MPTVFAEPSADAVNGFMLWQKDLDLVKSLGLNSYRFSIEWARIEPEPGQFSVAMLNHYTVMVEGCRARGLAPMVTFNNIGSPRWFSAQGGWLNPQAPELFARYCGKIARHLGRGISHAITFNEPNIPRLLRISGLPPFILDKQRAMLSAAAKAVNPDLPVGASLAMFDDQAAGENSLLDAKRMENYGAWLEAAKDDDFLGVQNYERVMCDNKGKVTPPAGSIMHFMGSEVHAPSLAGAVRFAHQATGVPIMVTEHGVGTDDDTVRAKFIPAVLKELKLAIDEGMPVKGYVHWSLLDNYEWMFGYKPHFGLASVDRNTFVRKAKPSAAIYAAIARRNGLGRAP